MVKFHYKSLAPFQTVFNQPCTTSKIGSKSNFCPVKIRGSVVAGKNNSNRIGSIMAFGEGLNIKILNS